MRQVWIAIDQLLNTLFGGWADETLSSRAWRAERDGTRWHWTRRGIDLIFFWEHDHCYQSYMSEKRRLQMPPEER
jgi:hypothetical protein